MQQNEEAHEVVIEKTLAGKYRLPDAAIDLSAWIRDGLEVYNLFVLMKPTFFQMLEALGGEFRASMRTENDNLESPSRKRIRFRTEYTEDYDQIIVVQLVSPETDEINEEYSFEGTVPKGPIEKGIVAEDGFEEEPL